MEWNSKMLREMGREDGMKKVQEDGVRCRCTRKLVHEATT
jgi:hypothetical protein